jgi:hypothetical protein
MKFFVCFYYIYLKTMTAKAAAEVGVRTKLYLEWCACVRCLVFK